MKIDISNWNNYGEVEEILDKYNKEDISELLKMNVEITNYDDENCFESLTKKLVSLDKITDFEKITLCKYVLCNFYQIFFERKTVFKDNSKIVMTRFRELEENELFEDIFDTYLELFKTGSEAGNEISRELFRIFKDIENVDKLPSDNEEIEYTSLCDECKGYGYIDYNICPCCKGERTTFFTDYDLSEYYKKIYRHEVNILSFDAEEVKECFVDILKNMFGESKISILSYYKPKCKLIGEDGNIFNLLRLVMNALKREGLLDEAKAVNEEVLAASSYDESLRIFMKYVEVC